MNEIPIKKNDKIKVTIESIGRKGDGVAKYNGFIIMVPNSKLNNTYDVIITDIYDTFAFGIIRGGNNGN